MPGDVPGDRRRVQRRLLVVSHPAVVAVNQLVYAELVHRGWHVDLVVPAQWQHEYAAQPFRPIPVPALAGSFHPLPVALPGRPQRHFHLANPTRVIRLTRPDVVFVEQEPLALAAFQWGVAARCARVPFGVQIDENVDRNVSAPVRWLRTWVLRNAAYVAARSPTAAGLAQRWGARGDVGVVPHHVPGWERRDRVPYPHFRVGFAGRLVPEKGLPVLVDALRRIEGPLEFVVAGDGPLRPWLEDQDLGAARLRMMAGLGHDRMDEAYAQMDVLVLPSRATPGWVEQFGRVLVEALCCGIPVVGSDTGEIPWVISVTGGGRTFPDGDSLALARILESLRDDAELRQRYAVQGEARVRTLFSVEAVASVLEPMLARASARVPPCDASGQPDRRPRVLLVAHGIHDRGGMERACAELIRHTHRDIAFTAVTTELAPDLNQLVARWVRIRVPRRPIPLKFLAFFLVAGIAVRRLRAAPAQRAGVVHTVGALIPNRTDIAGVHFCHAGARRAVSLVPSDAPLTRQANTAVAHGIALLAERWCYRPDRVKVFAPVSAGVAAELNIHYPDVRSVVVPNGVDIECFRPDVEMRARQRESAGVGEEEMIALFVGGDWARKGLGLAVDAVARARDIGTPLRLWVVGTGDQRRFNLNGFAAAGGVDEWVRFFGYQSETARFYQAADLFVLPSRYETFSLVSYEAAACGLPIVATPVHGVTELVGADAGGMIVSRDVKSVCAALVHLAESPDDRRRLGAEAHRRAIAYTWDHSAATMLELYQTVPPSYPATLRDT